MYELEIKTIYNTIKLVVDNLENEQVQEILQQPYVKEVKAKEVAKEVANSGKKLVKKW